MTARRHEKERIATGSALRASPSDIAALSRWARATWRGERRRASSARARIPSRFKSLSAEDVTVMLRNAVRTAIQAGDLSHSEGRRWLEYRSLVERSAAEQGIGRDPHDTPRAARSMAERVERLLARRPLHPPRGGSSRPRQGQLVALHTRLAWDRETDPAVWVALDEVRREAGHAVSVARGHVPAQRKRRAAARLRAAMARPPDRLRPARSGAPLPELDAQDVLAVVQADDRDNWTHRRVVRERVDEWRLEERDFRTLPRDVAVRAWSLRRRLWREDEDIRALQASRVVRALAPGSLAAVHSYRDDAIVLQAHGYADLAVAACRNAHHLVGVLDDPRLAAHERGQILGRMAIASPPTGTDADRQSRLRLHARAMEETEAGGQAAWDRELPGLLRREIDIEIGHHLARSRGHRGRPERLVLDETVLHQAEMAVERLGNPLLAATWRTTVMRWALAAGDALEFQRAAEVFSDRLLALNSPLPNQAWRYRALYTAATRRRGLWSRIDLPEAALRLAPRQRPVTEPRIVRL